MDVELTPSAQRLLTQHVDSVGALDLLLLIHRTRDRDWGVDELCKQLRCPESWAENQLAGLAAAGLVTQPAEGRYRFSRGLEYGPAVDEIARTCRHYRARIVRMIFAGPPDQLAR